MIIGTFHYPQDNRNLLILHQSSTNRGSAQTRLILNPAKSIIITFQNRRNDLTSANECFTLVRSPVKSPALSGLFNLPLLSHRDSALAESGFRVTDSNWILDWAVLYILEFILLFILILTYLLFIMTVGKSLVEASNEEAPWIVSPCVESAWLSAIAGWYVTYSFQLNKWSMRWKKSGENEIY